MDMLGKRLLGGYTELHSAAAAGDLARLRTAVQKSPADIDKLNKVAYRPASLPAPCVGGPACFAGALAGRAVSSGAEDLQVPHTKAPLHVGSLA